MLKFFGGVSSAPDQTTPKASEQRNPFDFFTPSSRKGSVAQQGGLAPPTATPGGSAGNSGTTTAVASGSSTPLSRQSVSTPGVGPPLSGSGASAYGGGATATDPPPTPGAGGMSAPPTPGGAVRSQPTTGAFCR